MKTKGQWLGLLLTVIAGHLAFTMFSFSISDDCFADGSHSYKPAPKPVWIRPGLPGGTPSTPGAATPGGPSTPSLPGTPTTPGPGPGVTGGPRTGGPAGAGAFTRRARRPQQVTWRNTWRQWWSRNRYRYLELPVFVGKGDSRYVYTESSGSASKLDAAMSALRQKSISTIRLFLNDKSAMIRRASLISLGMLNHEKSLPAICNGLKDKNLTVRSAAVLALGLSDSGKADYTLINLARDTERARKMSDHSTIPTAMTCFAEISLALESARGASPILQNIASNDSCRDEIRAMALEGLGLLATIDSTRFLREFCADPKADYRLKSAAAIALGKTDDPLVVPALLELLSAKKVAVSQSAAIALGNVAQKGDEKVIRRLFLTFSRSSDPALKGFTLTSMGQIGGPAAIKNLKLAMKRGTSPDLPWICLGLGLALHAAPNETVPKELFTILKKNRNRSTQGAAAVALGLAGRKEAIPLLLATMENNDTAYLRGYCALALGMIGDISSIPALREALKEENQPEVNNQAALALCLLYDCASADDMVELLLTTNCEATKAMASRCLTFLGDGKVAERLLEFLNTTRSDEMTYMYCMELLSKLVMGRKIPYLARLAIGSNYGSEFSVVADLLEFGI